MDPKFDQEVLSLEEGPARIQGIVYLITNATNGKQYVGQTRTHARNNGKFRPYGILRRWAGHVDDAMHNRSNVALQRAIRKYGAQSFRIEEVQRCAFVDLNDAEARAIVKFGSLTPRGYNILPNANATTYFREHGVTGTEKKDLKRKHDYESIPAKRAVIHETKGVAPHFYVFFDTGEGPINEAPRTTFTCRNGREQALARAVDFARKHTSQIEFAQSFDQRKEKKAEELRGTIRRAHVRFEQRRFQVHLETEIHTTRRTMQSMTFYPSSGVAIAEGLQEAHRRADAFARSKCADVYDTTEWAADRKPPLPRRVFEKKAKKASEIGDATAE